MSSNEDEEVNPNVLYVETTDLDTGKPATLEVPGGYCGLYDSLTFSVKKYGDKFNESAVKIWAYDPMPGPIKRYVQVDIFNGNVAGAIEHLKHYTLGAEEVVASMITHIRNMARHSRLKSVAFNYVVEDERGENVAGGNMVVTDEESYKLPERMMMYGVMSGHLEEVKEAARKLGGHFEEDGPKIIMPR